MPRQSISLTENNNDWLQRVVASNEYASKSEVVNDLIRDARRKDLQLKSLRTKLEQSEKSGFTNLSKEEIRQQAKDSSK